MDDLIIKDRVFVIRLFITRNILSQYNSAFKEVHESISGGFRLYNQFCVFVYSQLQAIFSTTHLGNVADWGSYLSLNMDDETLPYKTVDEFLLDRDLSNLINDSKIPTPRRFIAQVISFYRCFLKILLTSELATSSFSRGLSSFDEAVVLGGSEVHYVDSMQLLCGYFVQQKWIAPHIKPVVVSEYCSLITKFRSDKICNNKEWVSFFSCHYELQSRIELFRLFRICCETLRNPSISPPLFIVPMPGLKSDANEFSSAVRSLQCTIASVQKVESLFLSPNSLPRIFDLLSHGPGLLLKRKFSVWHLLSSSYFKRLEIRSSLEAYHSKSAPEEGKPWMPTEDKAKSDSSGGSSAASTPSKSPEKINLPQEPSPVVRRLVDCPLFPDSTTSDASGKKKKMTSKSGSPVKNN